MIKKYLKLDKAKIKKAMLAELEKLEYFNTNEVAIKIKCEPDEKVLEPKIVFTTDAYAKLTALVHGIDKEIAWHGLIKRSESTYLIYDILVYPQKVAAVTVESDDEAYPLWIMNQSDDTINSMRMQGHSHVDMGVSPSGVDETYYSEQLKHVNDYYVFIIANKKGDMYIRVYDMKQNIQFSDVPYELLLENNLTQSQWSESEIKEHISDRVYTPVTHLEKVGDGYSRRYGNYGQGYYDDYNPRSYYSKEKTYAELEKEAYSVPSSEVKILIKPTNERKKIKAEFLEKYKSPINNQYIVDYDDVEFDPYLTVWVRDNLIVSQEKKRVIGVKRKLLKEFRKAGKS